MKAQRGAYDAEERWPVEAVTCGGNSFDSYNLVMLHNHIYVAAQAKSPVEGFHRIQWDE